MLDDLTIYLLFLLTIAVGLFLRSFIGAAGNDAWNWLKNKISTTNTPHKTEIPKDLLDLFLKHTKQFEANHNNGDFIHSTPTSEKPVSLSGMLSNAGWLINFQIIGNTKEIFYKFKNDTDYVSTGFSTATNPQTGGFMPQTSITVPNLKGRYIILVKFTDYTDNGNGPYELEFDTSKQLVTSVKQILMHVPEWLYYNEGELDNKQVLLVYFSALLSYRNAIKEIKYSVDNDSLSESFSFTPWTESGAPQIKEDDDIYISVPLSTKFICVKIMYVDDTESEVLKQEHKPAIKQ